jgi:hypothetical protein
MSDRPSSWLIPQDGHTRPGHGRSRSRPAFPTIPPDRGCPVRAARQGRGSRREGRRGGAMSVRCGVRCGGGSTAAFRPGAAGSRLGRGIRRRTRRPWRVPSRSLGWSAGRRGPYQQPRHAVPELVGESFRAGPDRPGPQERRHRPEPDPSGRGNLDGMHALSPDKALRNEPGDVRDGDLRHVPIGDPSAVTPVDRLPCDVGAGHRIGGLSGRPVQ